VPSEAFHPHYYAGESRVYACTPIIAAASSAVKPFDIESAGGLTRSCRAAQGPPPQRLRVNAERCEPKGNDLDWVRRKPDRWRHEIYKITGARMWPPKAYGKSLKVQATVSAWIFLRAANTRFSARAQISTKHSFP
jgi:hypothetical protein